MAVENGKILARALTGIAGSTKQQQGYFTLFDAQPRMDAVQLLVEEMCAWQRRMGSRSIVGPIAPTPVDLGGGVLSEGFGEAAFEDAFNMPYYDEYLQKCGFQVESEWLAYRINIEQQFDREKYRRTADKLKERFGYQIKKETVRNPRRFADAVCAVMQLSNGNEQINRVIGQMLPFIEPRLSPVVFVENKPIGFLLTIKKAPQPPRIVTLWVHEMWRRKGVTAVLFDEAAQQAEAMNFTNIDASLIRKDNMASRLGVEYAGGRVIHRYRQYEIDF